MAAVANPAAAAVPAAGQPAAAPAGPVTSSSLWVGELQPEVTEAMLFEIFNGVGPVASVRVCRDAVTRRSLGYAYVNFQSAADADRALDTMNYEPINGKSCRIMWCQRDPTVRRYDLLHFFIPLFVSCSFLSSGVGNIFVKGLDASIDNKALYDAFSIFGNILSVKVVLDGNGQSTGRGFVHFETAQDAQEAIDKADGTLLKDKKINVAHFKSRKEVWITSSSFSLPQVLYFLSVLRRPAASRTSSRTFSSRTLARPTRTISLRCSSLSARLPHLCWLAIPQMSTSPVDSDSSASRMPRVPSVLWRS